MSNSFVQLRTNDVMKVKAAQICERLGIDIPTYLRICLARLIEENGIPFSMKLDRQEMNAGTVALHEAQRLAKEKGLDKMSLEEINAEIEQTRCELRNRHS